MLEIPIKSKIDDFRLFKVSKMKEIVKPIKPHKHANYFEIIFLKKCSVKHTVDNQTFTIQSPTVFFLKPNQTHCWDFSSILIKGYVLYSLYKFFINTLALKKAI